jgi:hypothetical protein
MHLNVYFTSQLLPRPCYSLLQENTGCTFICTTFRVVYRNTGYGKRHVCCSSGEYNYKQKPTVRQNRDSDGLATLESARHSKSRKHLWSGLLWGRSAAAELGRTIPSWIDLTSQQEIIKQSRQWSSLLWWHHVRLLARISRIFLAT